MGCGVTRAREIVCVGGFALAVACTSLKPSVDPSRTDAGLPEDVLDASPDGGVEDRPAVDLAAAPGTPAGDAPCLAARCGAQCVDLSASREHCGACGRSCTPWQVCVEGACQRDVVQLALGTLHTCALRRSGAVSCWGANSDGQLGDRTSSLRMSPVAVTALSGVVQITAGVSHTCALLATGTLSCWGNNFFGELGDGTNTDRNAPTGVPGIDDVMALQAGGTRWDGGSGHTCALRRSGEVRCWGANYEGQLGDGTNVTPRLAPVVARDVVGARAGVGSLGVGGRFSCALQADGGVRCWGDAESYQLGNGSPLPSNLAVRVAGVSDAVSVVAGYHSACALQRGGGVLCWGGNNSGQLGDGTTTTRSAPVAVLGLPAAPVVELAHQGSNACARCADGTLYCWGTTLGLRSVTAVLRLTEVEHVAAGMGHLCAIRTSGEVWCWGDNTSGQLGDGTRVNRNYPARALPLP